MLTVPIDDPKESKGFATVDEDLKSMWTCTQLVTAAMKPTTTHLIHLIYCSDNHC